MLLVNMSAYVLCVCVFVCVCACTAAAVSDRRDGGESVSGGGSGTDTQHLYIVLPPTTPCNLAMLPWFSVLDFRRGPFHLFTGTLNRLALLQTHELGHNGLLPASLLPPWPLPARQLRPAPADPSKPAHIQISPHPARPGARTHRAAHSACSPPLTPAGALAHSLVVAALPPPPPHTQTTISPVVFGIVSPAGLGAVPRKAVVLVVPVVLRPHDSRERHGGLGTRSGSACPSVHPISLCPNLPPPPCFLSSLFRGMAMKTTSQTPCAAANPSPASALPGGRVARRRLRTRSARAAPSTSALVPAASPLGRRAPSPPPPQAPACR